MSRTSVSVDLLNGPEVEKTERVTLTVRYADKVAQIELPVPAPQFDQESGVEAYRRELLRLVAALREWEASCEAITWHPNP